jgi:glycosyltransferase involved in cell wall biosynthesis
MIYETLRRHRPEAVIGIYVIHAYPLLFVKKILKFSLFTMVSGGDLELHNGILWRIIRKAVYRSSLIIFTTAARLKVEIERETGYQALVVPTGTDPDYYKPLPSKADLKSKYNFRKNDFVVLTLCNLIERKCVDDVIKAVKILNDKYHNAKMIIAGDGPEKSTLMRVCTEFNQDVVFMGYVGEVAKRELFNIADVYVLASYQEGMPFSVMEAMSCGCICICTNVGDLPQMIEDSVNGYLIKPRDPRLIAMKLEKVMGLSEQQLCTIRYRARQTILDRYDFRKLTKEMVEAIERKVSCEKH